MGFQVAELFATIKVNDAGLNKSLTGIRGKLERTQVSMQKLARAASRMFLVQAAAIALFAKEASDAQEIQSKFEAVFKEQTEAMEEWVDAQSKALGRAKVDLKAYTSTLQDTFVPMGFARREAAKLARQLTVLSIDLASFNNTSDASVIKDLQSALVGNTETVRKYGIIITQASLEQELLAQGIKKSATEMTEQEKVLARLSIIMRSTTDAQGDALRTAGSFANQIKALRSQLKEMSANLGSALLPALSEFVTTLTPIISNIAEWAQGNEKLIASVLGLSTALLAVLIVLPKISAGLTLLAAHPAIAAITLLLGIIAAKILKITSDMAALKAQIEKTAAGVLGIGRSREALERRLTLQLAEQLRLTEEIIKAKKILRPGVLGTVAIAAKDLFTLDLSETGTFQTSKRLELLTSEMEGLEQGIQSTRRALESIVDVEIDFDPIVDAAASGIESALEDDLWPPELQAELFRVANAARDAGLELDKAFGDLTFGADARKAEEFERALGDMAQAAVDAGLNLGKVFGPLTFLKDLPMPTPEDIKFLDAFFFGKATKPATGSAFSGIEELSRNLQRSVFRKEQEAKLKDNTDALKKQSKETKKNTDAVTGLGEKIAAADFGGGMVMVQ